MASEWGVSGKSDWVVGLILSDIEHEEAEGVFDDLSDLACDCECIEDAECRLVFGSLRQLPAAQPEPDIEVTYDSDADAGYIYVDGGRSIDHTIDLGRGFLADVDSDGYVVGIELLGGRLRPDLAQALVGKTSRAHRSISVEGSE